MIANLVLMGVFAVGAGFLGVLALRAHRRQLPYGSGLGLPGAAIRASRGAWEDAHAAATPFFATAAIICLIQAAAFGVAAAYPNLVGGSYTWLLVALGCLLVGLLLLLAIRAAKETTF